MSFSLILFIVVAALLLLRAASTLSRAGRLARPMQALVGRSMQVRAFGTDLPGPLSIESVHALGAGLLIYAIPPQGKRTLLKVAQPGELRVEGDRLVIAEARYVEWDRRRITAQAGAPAVVLTEA